jgi:hypothetical protein
MAAITHDTHPWPTPLEELGAIGDLHTAVLVSRHGSIDWLCWSRFDAPSLFGRLLDPDGGHWRIAPADADRDCSDQIYLSGTNVLVTRFHLPDALVEVEDLMLIGGHARALPCSTVGARRETRCTPRSSIEAGTSTSARSPRPSTVTRSTRRSCSRRS